MALTAHSIEQESVRAIGEDLEAVHLVDRPVRRCTCRILLATIFLAVVLAFLLGFVLKVARGGFPSQQDVVCEETYDVVNLGTTSWLLPNASSALQKLFDQGILLCASFNHDEALRTFHAAVKLDPREPLLHWAIAYSMSGNLNRPLTSVDRLQLAKESTQMMISLSSSGRRISTEESILFNATAARFPIERSVMPPTWVSRYDIAYYEVLHEGRKVLKQPSANFLALLGQSALETDPWNYYVDGTAKIMKPVSQVAYQALREALQIDQTHPLALHYMIHLLEVASPLRDEALAVAEALESQFGNGGPGHLAHMPSHAYNRAGQYHAASTANLRAIAADTEYFEVCKNRGVDTYNAYYKELYFCHDHAVLLFSLQAEGRLNDTLAALNGLEAHCHIDYVGDNLHGVFQIYSHGATRDLTMLRFGMWHAIMQRPVMGILSPKAGFARAIRHFARAVSLVSLGGAEACKEARLEHVFFMNVSAGIWNDTVFHVNRLDVTTVKVTKGDILKVANFSLSARLAGACGPSWQEEEAAWQSAVDATSALPYFEPPFWSLNPSLCLGERQRLRGDFTAASATFARALEQAPSSGWALFGLWQALKGHGQKMAADEAERKFKEAWRFADFQLVTACY